MKSLYKKVITYILTLEARAVLTRYKPKIIAVTGNVGKTSTKDAIYTVLAKAYGKEVVRKSEKSFNSEIGLPLTVLGLENAWSSPLGWLRNIWRGLAIVFRKKKFPQWLVLEVGADHPGDIEEISKWLRPSLVVLTRMSDTPVHVEFFENAEAVLREKMFLARALSKDGILVVNADDPHFTEAVKNLPCQIVWYGASKNASSRIIESEVFYGEQALSLPLGERVTIRMGNGSSEVEARIKLRGVIGDHVVYPIAAASAVAEALHIESFVESAFAGFESPRGRMRLVPGLNSSAIIDDTYNSSPLACSEALKTLGKLSAKGKKIALLGDMKELGVNSECAHKEIGVLAFDVLHTLVTVGEAARWIAEAALAAGFATDRVHSFSNSEEAGAFVRDIIRAGDIALVKGSQSMRMERATKILLADPSLATELLVRQDEVWLGKK